MENQALRDNIGFKRKFIFQICVFVLYLIWAGPAFCADVFDFGAKINGFTDDTVAIQKALNGTPKNHTLTCKGDTAKITDTIKVPGNIDLDFDCLISYEGPDGRPAIEIGDSSSYMTGRKFEGLRVNRKVTSNWSNESDIGILVHSMSHSYIEIFEASEFTIGVQFLATAGGVSYNKIDLNLIAANKYGIDLKSNALGKVGYLNENIFNGGRFSVWKKINVKENRYGVRFSTINGGYITHNNNKFYNQSFEIGCAKQCSESVPFLMNAGKGNQIFNARSEQNGQIFAIENDPGFGLNTYNVSNAGPCLTIQVNRSNKGKWKSVLKDYLRDLIKPPFWSCIIGK